MSAPTYILLRGLAREAGHWGAVPELLRQAGVTVHTIDSPGMGSRRDEAVPSTIPGIMEAIRARAPQTAERPYVYAMSLGGMVALEWAKQHGDELAGVVIGNSSVAGLSPPWHRLRPQSWPRTFGNFFRTDLTSREASILRMVANDEAGRQATLPQWVQVSEVRPPSRTAAMQQLLAASRFVAPSPPLRCLLHVLVSDGDRMVNPDCSRQIARAYRATLAVHPSAGHDLGIDAPEWVVDQLLHFAGR